MYWRVLQKHLVAHELVCKFRGSATAQGKQPHFLQWSETSYKSKAWSGNKTTLACASRLQKVETHATLRCAGGKGAAFFGTLPCDAQLGLDCVPPLPGTPLCNQTVARTPANSHVGTCVSFQQAGSVLKCSSPKTVSLVDGLSVVRPYLIDAKGAQNPAPKPTHTKYK